MEELHAMKCIPCQKGAPKATDKEIAEFLSARPEWKLIERDGEKRIERVFDIAAKNQGVTREQIIATSNAHSALGRMVKPEEVAELAVFLTSDKSSAITGQTISIDCGSNFN